MAKLKFDEIGEHFYETGVSDCVLFVMGDDDEYETGVAWNGITAITESPSGAEANAIYADNIKYLNIYSAEEFGATIEAYTYPDEFEECDGSKEVADGVILGQQQRKSFAIAYKTKMGNDTQGDEFGYKLHIIYNCKASPSERNYQTINDSPEAINFSWELTTVPVAVTGNKPTSLIVINSKTADETKLQTLIDKIYGTDANTEAGTTGSDPTLPMPDDVISMMSTTAPEDPEEDPEDNT